MKARTPTSSNAESAPKETDFRLPHFQNAHSSIVLSLLGTTSSSTPLFWKHCLLITSSPSPRSTCPSELHEPKIPFLRTFRFLAALRSAYSKFLHSQKAYYSTLLTLAGSASFRIPVSFRQLLPKLSRPSLNLTDLSVCAHLNAQLTMTLAVRGREHTLPAPLIMSVILLLAIISETTTTGARVRLVNIPFFGMFSGSLFLPDLRLLGFLVSGGLIKLRLQVICTLSAHAYSLCLQFHPGPGS